jgi:phosphoglycolate phosphatase
VRSDKLVDECVKKMFIEYGKRWDAKTRPYAGIPELLETLSAHNIPMSIVSNKEDSFTIRVVEKFLGRWEFRAVFGERSGVARKPDPVSLLEAAGLMGLGCEDIICLGDSGSDMTAAINAGMLPVGALWGFRDAKELNDHGAKVLVKQPVEVAELF